MPVFQKAIKSLNMKAKILTPLILFISTISFAQNTITEHLSFKGTPVDGSLSEFVSKMKQSGFDLERSESSTTTLSGDFAGYKECFVEVSTLKQKDLVYKIVVTFPAKDTWAGLFENYSNLKEMLTEKYGKASEIVEKFDEQGSQERDDRTKMYYVKLDNCKYYSIWQTEKGRIELSIANKRLQKSFVQVSYLDKANANIIRDKAKEDL